MTSRVKLKSGLKSTKELDSIVTAEGVFAEAASKFQSDFQVVDKGCLAVQTPESLVDALAAYIDTLRTPHHSRLHDAISKVASFAGAFEPYFKIVEIMIGSHPEYAAIAWGAVRLLFQVSHPTNITRAIKMVG